MASLCSLHFCKISMCVLCFSWKGRGWGHYAPVPTDTDYIQTSVDARHLGASLSEWWNTTWMGMFTLTHNSESVVVQCSCSLKPFIIYRLCLSAAPLQKTVALKAAPPQGTTLSLVAASPRTWKLDMGFIPRLTFQNKTKCQVIVELDVVQTQLLTGYMTR